jgi:PhnB protein
MSNQLTVNKDLANKKLIVKRNFDAPVHNVWRAWTEKELLDQWWAPKPWRTETKSLDFRIGGMWLYSMVGPENERHWCRADYTKIDPDKRFDITEYFCDENGVKNETVPTMDWEVKFAAAADGTDVLVEIKFATEEDMKTIVGMGMVEGFSAALGNLEQYLKAQFGLWIQTQAKKARTSTYLNFPGNTEEAFNFYKEVFGTDFNGEGIRRFGDIPPGTGHPPVADNIKDMVLHVELPILGGHILMATDAPKEMGFTLTTGNNMHICLEPETRVETKRLFDALTEDGIIIMPLTDMFFGAYFGQGTDKYGINWMFNCFEKP